MTGDELRVLSEPQDGQASAISGTTTTSSTTTTSGDTTTTSPFVININWDTSVADAPLLAFKNGVIAAVNYLESQFVDPITVTINVGYGEVYGNPYSGALGSSVRIWRTWVSPTSCPV